MKKEVIKTIGKETEKIGDTMVTGEGAMVTYTQDEPETVAVRDYVAGKGYSGIVNWDGKNPTVAGVKVNPTEIRDGISYAKKSDMDSILSDFEKRAGVVNPEAKRREKYGAMEDSALKKITERKEFSYDTEDDPAYQAYKKQYERLADEALRRILNANNTSVTGASGAVLAEAMAARDKELNKITDKIPELYADAFDRYIKEGERLTTDFKTISGAADSYYDRVYESDSELRERINEAGAAEREERQRQIENENEEYDNALKAIEAKYLDEKMRTDIEKSRATAEETTMDNAIARGFFTESDEAVLGWLKGYKNADGTYSIDPSVAKTAYEYQAANARERGKLNAKRGLR